jgi:hypothetical protein
MCYLLAGINPSRGSRYRESGVMSLVAFFAMNVKRYFQKSSLGIKMAICAIFTPLPLLASLLFWSLLLGIAPIAFSSAG